MKLTIKKLLAHAKAFGDDQRQWQYGPSAKAQAPQGARPGRELFTACIDAVEAYLGGGDGQGCFDASSAIGLDRAAREGGPRGIYGAMHVSTAAWYESKGQFDDRDRLLRCAQMDIGHIEIETPV